MAMHTLVNYVDNTKAELDLAAAQALAPMPKKAAPAVDPSEPDASDSSQTAAPAKKGVVKNTAQHIADHIQDPVGSTKEMFDELGQKNLEYEQAKAKARVTLAPVKAILQHVDQTHGLEPENEDQSMGYHQPGDPNGNQPQPMPGQMTKPIPANMATTPQQMNRNRPSAVGVGRPGIPAGPAQSVRPGKMGVPSPGGGGGNPARPGQSANKKSAGNGRSIKVHIQGAGDMGDAELRNKIQEALREYYNTPDSGGPDQVSACGIGGQKYPWIEDVFSAGKYVVYNLDGKKYKIGYSVTSKGVKLVGDPKPVRIAYVEAKADKLSTIMAGVDAGAQMTRK